MATFQWINENEIESGYFWDVPASNPLVSLGVLEEWIPEPTWLAKTISRQQLETEDTWVWAKIAESFWQDVIETEWKKPLRRILLTRSFYIYLEDVKKISEGWADEAPWQSRFIISSMREISC